MKRIGIISLAILLPLSTPVTAQNIFPDKGLTSGSVGIFNCDAPGDKQKTGAIIGAVVGGVIGNKVSKDNKTLGTVIGAAVGGAAGSYVGCRLQRKDQEKLAADNERALALGQNAIYTNEETGIRGETTVISNTNSTKQNVKVLSTIKAPNSLVLMGAQYAAANDVVIRSSPLKTSKVVGGIGQGEVVNVLGRTAGAAPWAAISQGGVIKGYIPLSSLNATGQIAELGTPVTLTTKIVNIPVTSVCRNVSQKIIENGQSSDGASASRKACVQTDGSWKSI